MKDKIVEKLNIENGLTFVQLSDIEGFEGEYAYEIPEVNCVVWVKMSSEFIRAIQELERDSIIKFDTISPLVYAGDGATLDLPVARRTMAYKTPHWVPTIIKKGDRFFETLGWA